ncbi:unnamed protein product, partial [Effrenium voratum]
MKRLVLLLALHVAARKLSESRENLNLVFDELDLDQDDGLSEDELGRGRSLPGFQQLDLDQDGLVSRSEFASQVTVKGSGLALSGEHAALLTTPPPSPHAEADAAAHAEARPSLRSRVTRMSLVEANTFQCFTGPGRACKVCRDLEARTADDQCLECNEGYKLSSQGFCEAFACDVESLEGCKHCRATHERTADNQCSECEKGFGISDDFSCKA